jgi:RNA polymerase sigma-70 factor (ECF subfamily)
MKIFTNLLIISKTNDTITNHFNICIRLVNMAGNTTYKLTVEQTQQHIIEGCMQQQPASQEVLYKQLYSEMMGVCSRYTYNEDDAAALYNEAMLKVFSKIKQYQFQGSFVGWVKRIVVNTCIDQCRKNTQFKNQQWVDEEKAEHVAINDFICEQISANEILSFVHTLPKNTAFVFNMFVIEGYKHHEIASFLGITEGTSKWHLNEARRLLKDKILHHFDAASQNILTQ